MTKSTSILSATLSFWYSDDKLNHYVLSEFVISPLNQINIFYTVSFESKSSVTFSSLRLS